MDNSERGKRGGKARSLALSPERRSEIASKAALKRWRGNVPATVKDKDDVLILNFRLASGKFESTIQVPLFASDAEKQGFVDAWLFLMEAGLKAGRSARENKNKTFTNSEKLAKAIFNWLNRPQGEADTVNRMEDQPPYSFNADEKVLKIGIDGVLECKMLADAVIKDLTNAST